MRSFLFLFSGIIIGFWSAWPGIVNPNNWKCFKDIINKSSKEQISLKAALSVSPNYLLKGKKNDIASKIRIVSDACFR
tara:strand:- start:214 stop:447 length:234 start_codon:yes stop_codon:yes gene_type:complete